MVGSVGPGDRRVGYSGGERSDHMGSATQRTSRESEREREYECEPVSKG